MCWQLRESTSSTLTDIRKRKPPSFYDRQAFQTNKWRQRKKARPIHAAKIIIAWVLETSARKYYVGSLRVTKGYILMLNVCSKKPKGEVVYRAKMMINLYLALCRYLKSVLGVEYIIPSLMTNHQKRRRRRRRSKKLKNWPHWRISMNTLIARNHGFVHPAREKMIHFPLHAWMCVVFTPKPGSGLMFKDIRMKVGSVTYN